MEHDRHDDIAGLLDQPVEWVEAPLRELKRRELAVEVDDGMELAHQLVADAFLRCAIPTRRARLHQRASLQATSVHTLARHQLEAGDLVDPDDRRAAVLRSARLRLEEGAFWESVTSFDAATAISDRPLDAEALIDYSAALSFAGDRERATIVRQQAYDAAIGASRLDLAHDAAIASLPATEAEDGEDDRLRQLLAIPPGRLDDRRQLSQALHLARLAAMSGDLDTGGRWADRALELADDDEDRVQAALGRRFVDWTLLPPETRSHRLVTATAGLTASPAARCRLAQFAVIDNFESGNLGAAHHALDDLLALSAECGEALRHWHGLIQRSMFHETAGEWGLADAAADAALRHGHRHGMTSASIVRLSQSYFRLRFTGDLALLASAVDQMPEPDGQSSLYGSARATILDAAGRHDEAARECRRIAQRAIDRPSSAGLSCLAILVPVLARHGSLGMRLSARALLAPFEHNVLIVGSGLANLGPVNYLMHQLERPSGELTVQGLRGAIRQADNFAMTAWSVRYRLELAALTGSRGPLDEADAHAGTSDLAPLVARALSRF